MHNKDVKYELEQSLGEKIRSLGFMCYNLFVDGAEILPEMKNIVFEIHSCMEYLNILRNNNANLNLIFDKERELNDKLSELGCICYNMFIDKKLFSGNVIELCNAISEVNIELSRLQSMSDDGETAIRENTGKANETREIPNIGKSNEPAEKAKQKTEKKVWNFSVMPTALRSKRPKYPFGMEPIPDNYRQCMCGYRNRNEAKYCARCGARLYSSKE